MFVVYGEQINEQAAPCDRQSCEMFFKERKGFDPKELYSCEKETEARMYCSSHCLDVKENLLYTVCGEINYNEDGEELFEGEIVFAVLPNHKVVDFDQFKDEKV